MKYLQCALLILFLCASSIAHEKPEGPTPLEVTHQHLYPKGIESKFIFTTEDSPDGRTTTVCKWISNTEYSGSLGTITNGSPYTKKDDDSFHKLTIYTEIDDFISMYLMSILGRVEKHNIYITKVEGAVEIVGNGKRFISDKKTGDWAFYLESDTNKEHPITTLCIPPCGEKDSDPADPAKDYMIKLFGKKGRYECMDLDGDYRKCSLEILSTRAYRTMRTPYKQSPAMPTHDVLPPPGGSTSGGNN